MFPKNGKQFFTSTHELLIHQQQFLIRAKPLAQFQSFKLDKDVVFTRINSCKSLKISYLNPTDVVFTSNKNEAFFDADKLGFPLEVRTWMKGDYFCPFGMKGKKQKLQNYYSNKKLSLFEKETTFLLTSDGEICWVMGMRMDERFKIDEGTRRVVCFTFVDKR